MRRVLVELIYGRAALFACVLAWFAAAVFLSPVGSAHARVDGIDVAPQHMVVAQLKFAQQGFVAPGKKKKKPQLKAKPKKPAIAKKVRSAPKKKASKAKPKAPKKSFTKSKPKRKIAKSKPKKKTTVKKATASKKVSKPKKLSKPKTKSAKANKKSKPKTKTATKKATATKSTRKATKSKPVKAKVVKSKPAKKPKATRKVAKPKGKSKPTAKSKKTRSVKTAAPKKTKPVKSGKGKKVAAPPKKTAPKRTSPKRTNPAKSTVTVVDPRLPNNPIRTNPGGRGSGGKADVPGGRPGGSGVPSGNNTGGSRPGGKADVLVVDPRPPKPPKPPGRGDHLVLPPILPPIPPVVGPNFVADPVRPVCHGGKLIATRSRPPRYSCDCSSSNSRAIRVGANAWRCGGGDKPEPPVVGPNLVVDPVRPVCEGGQLGVTRSRPPRYFCTCGSTNGTARKIGPNRWRCFGGNTPEPPVVGPNFVADPKPPIPPGPPDGKDDKPDQPVPPVPPGVRDPEPRPDEPKVLADPVGPSRPIPGDELRSPTTSGQGDKRVADGGDTRDSDRSLPDSVFEAPQRENEVVVFVDASRGEETVADIADRYGLRPLAGTKIVLLDQYVQRYSILDDRSVKSVTEDLLADPSVAAAQPNLIYRPPPHTIIPREGPDGGSGPGGGAGGSFGTEPGNNQSNNQAPGPGEGGGLGGGGALPGPIPNQGPQAGPVPGPGGQLPGPGGPVAGPGGQAGPAQGPGGQAQGPGGQSQGAGQGGQGAVADGPGPGTSQAGAPPTPGGQLGKPGTKQAGPKPGSKVPVPRKRKAKGKKRGRANPQYALAKLGLPDAHGLAQGRDVLVAIIDTGIDPYHPAVSSSVVDSYRAFGNRSAGDFAHATALAGVIAGRGTIKGVAPKARLLDVQAFHLQESGGLGVESDTFILARGIDWAIEKGARIMNMSFTGPADPALHRIVRKGQRNGAIFVAAAGNEGEKAPPAYPAAYEGVIAITAIDETDSLYGKANRGRYVVASAPGVNVLVAAPGRSFGFLSGTSVAAAHVTGVAAMLHEHNAKLSASGFHDVISKTSHDLGPPGRDDLFGVGRVDATASVTRVMELRK